MARSLQDWLNHLRLSRAHTSTFPHMTRALSSLVASTLLLTAGCSNPSGVLCPAVVNRGIEVEVLDAVTGASVARGAAGVVTDGAFTDSLRPVAFRGVPPADTVTTLGAALGRAGVYTVRVQRPGYAAFERAGVRVVLNGCGVVTTRLVARLTPVP